MQEIYSNILDNKNSKVNTFKYRAPGTLVSTGAFSVIKIYPELAQAAIKERLHKEFSLWLELRYINTTSSGHMPMQDAIQALITTCNHTAPTARRLLKQGDSKYWYIYRHPGHNNEAWIELYGLRRLCILHNCYVRRSAVEVPLEEFSASRQSRTAWLYASFHGPEKNKPRHPIARATVQDVTGVHPRSQLNYEKITGVEVKSNHISQVIEYYGKSQVYHIHRQIGNSYTLPAPRASRGMQRRLNATLKGLRSCYSGEAPQTPIERRYFNSAKSYTHCKHRARECFLLVQDMVGGYKWQPIG